MKDYLYDLFFDIIKCYFEKSDYEMVHKVTDKLIKSYNEPHRKYHTLEHIVKCLDATQLLCNTNDMYMAILYHDIIYDPIAKDNEELSELAFIYDIPYGWRSDAGKLIRYMIRATTHDPEDILYKFKPITKIFDHDQHDLYRYVKVNVSSYQQHICDVDLHQLGCGLREFLYNESLIREEYKMVPDEIFYPARYKILQRFLDNNIYYSTIFKNTFGFAAKRNLQYVLDRQEIFSTE
jgi:predicted metal-dependent HD superfamily phosphohydrolase